MKTALIITTYNRPQYLSRCLESVRAADIPNDLTIIIVDDCSTDPETKRMFNEFNIDGVPIIKFVNTKNSKIYYSLKRGFDKAFEMGCDVVMNLDGDAIVKPNFFNLFLEVKHFPAQIITGFNSRNKRRDGTDRHEIVKQEHDILYKRSVGGINFCFDKAAYDLYVLPALQQCLIKPTNWDQVACIAAMADDKPVVCITPSVVQHIGFDSSMGHHEDPDVACDFFSLALPDVTLIGVDCVDINRLIKAAEYSQRNIKFGAVKMFSSTNLKRTEAYLCQPIKTKEQYSEFIINELSDHLSTSHALVIQYDGFVLNWRAWDNDWLQYDYIGATWWYKDGMNVGNGGFSLRSKRLMELLKNNPEIKTLHPEDHAIGRLYRPYLESKGIKFAPEEVANKFSIEAYNVPAPDNKYGGQFGFHGGNVNFKGTEHSHINPKAK